MQRILTGLISSVFGIMLFAQTAAAQSVDHSLDEAFKPVSDKVQSIVFYSVKIFKGTEFEQSAPLILAWLVMAGLFFSFYFGFVNVRMFGHALDLLRGKYDKEEGGEGQINRFQALSTSLSGTVGLGNIAGVAVAISVGGPGAMFWMMAMGFFGMSTKFTECSLAVKFRHKNPDDSFSGGPMYYISDGFAEKGRTLGKIGRLMAMFFAVCCIGGAMGGGNMFQANQSFQQFVNITGGEASYFADKGWLFGLILAVLVALVIIGGIQSIARVTSKIVPLMAIIYISAGLVIIFMNITAIPAAFGTILREAFGVDALAGGFFGALLQGVQRASFSNEAGIGSAPIAHATTKTKIPVSQGVVAMLEPFIDTIMICTITALVIVVTGSYNNGGNMEGVELTSRAFASAFSWFPYILGIAVILFAFSTMIAWSYYGLKAFTYLVGENKILGTLYKLVFCSVIILGAAANLSNVIGFTDAMIFAMALPNVIGLYVLAPGLKKDLKAYYKGVIKKEHIAEEKTAAKEAKKAKSKAKQ
ncbi:MAG: alanine:cation symporter family protein [Pseudomonadota bacterium]|nr:alanine:cation symporter family protein [Pseudomonadota bacterium]QKK04704.1 MAG: alanine:cation symporter family protein [Pseudomonadota bacterium]